MLLNFGRANLIQKVRQQPDKARLVFDKIKTDGLAPTLESVVDKLDKPLTLGYCNVGRVAEAGADVNGFSLNDRVVSNGAHAEVVSVPTNLCAKVPDSVTDDEAAFTVLGAVALQGIRLAKPTLGETIVVTGLGLVGLLAVQLLRANGCRVLGVDFDKEKLELARQFGAEVVDLSAGQDPVDAARAYSRGRGVDGVLVTAATESSEPMHQAALMCRKRGRIVLVGVTGLNLSRDDFFEKELTFQVSASYGPGRYDPNYEEKGHDYPIGFVRWTEQRNFEAVLDMMAAGDVDVKPLISHRFPISDAEKAYELIGEAISSLGILLEYPGIEINPASRSVLSPSTYESQFDLSEDEPKRAVVSFLGSGNYATSVLIPAFKEAKAHLRCVASRGGVSGAHAMKKFGFDETTTDVSRLFSDPSTQAVVVTTQHNSHAHYVLEALKSRKHVFVEKPLCLTLSELTEIENAYVEANRHSAGPPMLMVGFNRRFSPHTQRVKQLLTELTGPKSFILTVNAGAIPLDHWTQDLKLGGGRIIGEACHFIDLLRFLVGVPITSWQRLSMGAAGSDTTTIELKFADGSIGTVHYFANGSKAFPKERLEIFGAGRILQLDNFRRLTGYGWPGFTKMNLWRQNKGQKACAAAFVAALEGHSGAPIPFDEILEVSRVAIELAEA